MNDLAIFGMILISAIRLIGLGVSLDYYFETKKRKFRFFSFGWFVYFISGVLVITLYFYQNFFLFESLLVLNAILSTIGSIFVTIGLISYFIKIPIKTMISYIFIILLIIPIFIWILFNYRIAITYTVVNLNLFFLSVFFLSILKRSQFKKYMGRSIKWYYIMCTIFFSYIPLSIITIMQGYSFGLYYADNDALVMILYTITISTTILIILILLHVEYSISSQKKNQLTDKYSHNLGNALQAIYSSIDLLDFKSNFNKDNTALLEDILKPKLKEASDLIKEIRKL